MPAAWVPPILPLLGYTPTWDPSLIDLFGYTPFTDIVTGGIGETVLFDQNASLPNAVMIDDTAGAAIAQFNRGYIPSNELTFVAATDVDVTGASYEVNSDVTANDAAVSSGTMTIDANQTLDVTGNVALSGGITQISGGQISDAGNFTQTRSSELDIDLAAGMPTPVVVSGTVSLNGVLDLTALSGFTPSPGTVITLIQNNGPSAVSGEFSGEFQGLPEGSSVVVDNTPYILSYDGGNNGHSVVLTAAAPTCPVANYIEVNMGQGQTAAIDLVGNSYGFTGGGPLAATIVTEPTYGSVSYNAGNGLWSYTPTSSSYTGPDYFTYMVSGNGQQTSVAVVAIEVNPVNQAPSGTNNTITIAENTSYTFGEADFGFSDPNTPADNFAAVQITSLPVAGSLTDNGVPVTLGQTISVVDIDSGNLVFTPAVDAYGSPYDSFNFAVEDDGSTAYGGQTIDPSPKTMTINVSFVNQGPVGANNTVTTLENTPYTFAAADFGFSDPTDSPPFHFTAVDITTLPADGTLTDNGVDVTAGSYVSVDDINGGLLVYTPAQYANGAPYDSFTFQVQDDGGTTNGGTDTDPYSKTMTIDVTLVNQPPVGADNTVSFNTNVSYTFNQSDFGFSDPNNNPTGNFLAVLITTLPSNGVLTDNGTFVSAGQYVSVSDIDSGYLAYTPPTNAYGAGHDSFTFQVQNDGGTANGGVDTDPDPKTMSINVLVLPTATWGDPADITYGTPLSATQLDATASVPGTFSYTLDSFTNAQGAVLDPGGDQTLYVTFTPTDTTDYATTMATVAINVDIAPTIASTSTATFTEGTAGTFTAMASGFPAPTFSETGTLPSGVTLTSAGVLSGTPATGTAGTYSIVITASNGIGSDATQNFTLNVIDKAPTAVTYNVLHDHTLTANGSNGTSGLLVDNSDPDGDALSVAAVNGVAADIGQTITLSSGATLHVNADGSFVYVPMAHSAYTDPFTYTVSDGVLTTTGTATINLTDQAPTATAVTYNVLAGQTLTATANGIYGVLNYASDPDGDTLTVIAVNGVAASIGQTITLSSGATLQLNADGSFVYTSVANSAYTDSFTYTVSDGVLTSTGTATIIVTDSVLAPPPPPLLIP